MFVIVQPHLPLEQNVNFCNNRRHTQRNYTSDNDKPQPEDIREQGNDSIYDYADQNTGDGRFIPEFFKESPH